MQVQGKCVCRLLTLRKKVAFTPAFGDTITTIPQPGTEMEPSLSTEDYFPDIGTIPSIAFSNKAHAAMQIISKPKPVIATPLHRQKQCAHHAMSRTLPQEQQLPQRGGKHHFCASAVPNGAAHDEQGYASSDDDNAIVVSEQVAQLPKWREQLSQGTRPQRLVTLTLTPSKSLRRRPKLDDHHVHSQSTAHEQPVPGVPMRGGPHSLPDILENPKQPHHRHGQAHGSAAYMQAPLSGAAAAANARQALPPHAVGMAVGRGSTGAKYANMQLGSNGCGHNGFAGADNGYAATGQQRLHGVPAPPAPKGLHMKHMPGPRHSSVGAQLVNTHVPALHATQRANAPAGRPAPQLQPQQAHKHAASAVPHAPGAGVLVDLTAGSATQISNEPRQAPMLAAEILGLPLPPALLHQQRGAMTSL